ncbi:hypothetical protein LQE88_06110 [Acidaminococcus sp. NSJ-142]|jgi:hypothetical protein|uniref:hypothetical protein n=1 Tax=Acidaminococcus TaxID=904 RepID=UPI000CFA4E81|nr:MULTISPECIES: hypothetical protein [Acidaminococcus]MCD2435562.1 hypothetical protein [Acidaminococcus hominis]MCH4095642.1 hypothetical protein [Acidaminococcus provencensis]RHK01428.1 hypothetical protein DW089_06900 [Acidaminococcus sp. AM05-11]
MKKFGAILVAAACLLAPCFTQAEAQGVDFNPKRCVSVASSLREQTWVDLDSVKVVREEAPYYQIKARTFYRNYEKHQVVETLGYYYYNADKGELYSEPLTLIIQDRLTGKTETRKVVQPRLIPAAYLDKDYIAGNLVFHKVYGRWFSPDYPQYPEAGEAKG